MIDVQNSDSETGIKCKLQLRKGAQQTNENIQGYYVNEGHSMMRHLCSRSGKKKSGGWGGGEGFILVSVLNEFVEEIKELMRK